MPANDLSTMSGMEATLNLCREFARTALVLVRMSDPEQPAVRARISAIVMLMTSARLICKAEHPLEEIPREVLKICEDTFQKLSEQLARDLVPELAAQIDAEMARAGAGSSRESTIASLRALASPANLTTEQRRILAVEPDLPEEDDNE